MPDWLEALMPYICTIVVALIEANAALDRKEARQQKEKDDEVTKEREDERRVSMDLLSAVCALSITTAKKVHDQRTNGDVEAALKEAEEAQREYRSHLRNVVARRYKYAI